MKYKFGTVFLGLGFIKELLKEFNLPNIPVATEEMIGHLWLDPGLKDDGHLYEGGLYVKDLGVYRYMGVDYYPDSNTPYRKFGKVCDYYFNKPILNITNNMTITRSYYTTDMHEYLGNFLRFLRDYKHYNLMSLYNCFSNVTISPLDSDDSYNYFAMPVKFNQVYTIGLDSLAPVEMYCTLWKKTAISGSLIDSLERNTRVSYINCSMQAPVVYGALKNFDAKDYLDFFDCLKLIIKVPKYNSTSITVLEGDYTFNTKINLNMTTEAFYGPEEDIYHSKTYPTELSLFVNDEQQHPFADRLIEYLLDYAVTNMDLLDDNIKRVQEYLLYLNNTTPEILYGVWDEGMNASIYKSAVNSKINRYGADTIRYIKQKTDKIGTVEWVQIPGTSEGNWEITSEGVYPVDLIDVKKDLLMYMDKDVESLFLATGVNDQYTR